MPHIYDTSEGTVKLSKNPDGSHYAEVNNKWDTTFKDKEEAMKWLDKHKAQYVGWDHDE